MTTLPLRMRLYGFDLMQVYRSGSVAIYAQSRDGRALAWEVIRVRVAPAGRIMGKDYPEREVYPGAEQWGAYGWTCPSLASAQARLATIDCSIP